MNKTTLQRLDDIAAEYFASAEAPSAGAKCVDCSKPAVAFLPAGCCPGCGADYCEEHFLEALQHIGEGAI